MVDSIVVVGALTHCAMLHSVWDLKTAQMNMLYKFELGHNPTEATKNISYAKNEDAVDHGKQRVQEILFGL